LHHGYASGENLPLICTLTQLSQLERICELDQGCRPKGLHYIGRVCSADRSCSRGDARHHSLLPAGSMENILGLHYRRFSIALH